MQLQFPKKDLPCLRRIRSEVRTVEETQELRMPEDMPDIGTVLGAWGQVLIRSKQWRDDGMIVNGGVMTWVLYQPEGEEQQLQTAQCWIPFQLKWDLPETKLDGTIRVVPRIRNIDARSTSARKMVARVTVSVLGEAFVPEHTQIPMIEDVPQDVCLKKATYPMLLPMEAGEKIFNLEEDLSLPSSVPPVGKLLRYSLRPEVIDQKVLSGKAAFRGVAVLRLLYAAPEGQLCTWEFEIPFAQYTQLDKDYEQQAVADIILMTASLELEELPEGKLRLRAGMSGQYMVYDEAMVEAALDAYSPLREVRAEWEEVYLPAVLDRQRQNVCAAQSVHQGAGRILDTAFYPDNPSVRGSQICLRGQYRVLYMDEEMKLRLAGAGWEEEKKLPAGQDVELDAILTTAGPVQSDLAAGQIRLQSDLALDITATQGRPLTWITGLELGQPATPDPNRPSLIVRKKGKCSLWDLAKQTGSTVEAIEKANRLTSEPEEKDILLIPIP